MILLLMLCVGLIGANSLVLSPIAAEVAAGLGVGQAAGNQVSKPSTVKD